MKKVFILTAVFVLLGIAAQADVFNLGAGLTNLEMVTVGDPGNAADTRLWYGTSTWGSVGYTYNIGKYEVTAAQYCDFLNHKAKSDPYGLYNTAMDTAVNQYGCNIKRSGASDNYTYSVASDWANRPVNCVSYWNTCRFINWLNNGQGNGSTETGAYTLNGYTGNDGHTVQRNTEAKWFLPTEDEWYKAAYYQGGGTNADYWLYPTQSNTEPSQTVTTPDAGNNANFYTDAAGYSIGAPYYRTNVGEFENSESAYGTYDQGGNVWEWNETIRNYDGTYTFRFATGGAFNYSGSSTSAWSALAGNPTISVYAGGFRVAEAVPEPSSILGILSGIAGLGGMALRKRK